MSGLPFMYELVMSCADASTHNGEEPAVTSEPRILPSFIQSLKKTSASIDAGVVGSTGIAKLQFSVTGSYPHLVLAVNQNCHEIFTAFLLNEESVT
jgi:hypothetical protein